MAKISHISYEPFEARLEPEGVTWLRSTTRLAQRMDLIPTLPMVFFETGAPWTAANLWLAEKYDRVTCGEMSALSLHHNAWSLRAYLSFLEQSQVAWDLSPKREGDHPAILYRRHLIEARDERRLAPSTASARMACVANFYRWTHDAGILESSIIKNTTYHVVTRPSRYGFIKHKAIHTTNLHLKRKRSHPLPSIGGLSPVSEQTRDDILRIATKHCSQEFALMLTVGFSTGMRLQTILDLKIQTLASALPGEVNGISYLRVGPRYNVATKFSINGHALIPTSLLDRLQNYVGSLRRARRAARASPEHQAHVFLNRFGRPYGRGNSDRSPSVNVDMVRLRRAASAEGIDLTGFYFHCTRATFGTSIVLSGLRTEGVSVESIVCRLTELLMHRDEMTSMRYVRYVEGTKILAAHEASYSAWLFGQNKDD